MDENNCFIHIYKEIVQEFIAPEEYRVARQKIMKDQETKLQLEGKPYPICPLDDDQFFKNEDQEDF